MGRDHVLLRLALAFAAGIVVADGCARLAIPLSSSRLLLAAVVALLLTLLLHLLLRSSRSLFVVGVGLLLTVALVGACRYQSQRERIVVSWPDEKASYRAVVVDGPRRGERSVRYTLSVAGRRVYAYVFARRGTTTLPPDSLQPWRLGDELLLREVTIRPPSHFSDSLGFDYARYLYCQGISGTVPLPADRATVIGQGRSRGHLLLWARGVRARLSERYAAAAFPADVVGVVEALSIGEREHLSPALRDAYAAAGVSHVLALSGLHVSVLMLLIVLVLGTFIRGRHARVVIGLMGVPLLWLFAFVAGLSPSIFRAVTMTTLYLLATLFGGDRSSVSALALTAVVLLLLEPLALFDVGFCLSFAAMGGIVAFLPLGLRRGDDGNALALSLPSSRLLRAFCGWLGVSLAAQLGTFPLVLHHFGTFPTYFLVTNAVVVVWVYAVMALIVAWWALSWSPLQPALTAALSVTVGTLNTFLQRVATWPASQLRVDAFTLVDVVLTYLILLFLACFVQRRPGALLYAAACGALLIIARCWGI